MLEILNSKLLFKNLIQITSNYKVLYFDSMPILFSGYNTYGNLLIASSVDDDFENKIHQFFYKIVDISDYLKFMNRKITFKDLLFINNEIFVVNQDPDKQVLAVDLFDINDIDQSYIPSDTSFYPFELENSELSNLELVLHGKKADSHLALPSSIINLQNIVKYMFGTFTSINKNYFEFNKKLFVSAYPDDTFSQAGSFRLKFLIEDYDNLDQLELFPLEKENLFLLNKYFSYILNKLPDSFLTFLNSETIDNELKSLFDSFIKNINNYGKNISNDEFYSNAIVEFQKLIKKLNPQLNELDNSFDTIEFRNSNNQIGIINKEYKNNILSLKSIIEDKETVKNDNLEKFSIFIYQFSKKTRFGKANILTDKKLHSVSFNILGDKELSNSIFTKSFHENSEITVDAFSYVTKDNVIKKLDIEF